MSRCLCPACRAARKPGLADLAARIDELADDMADVAAAMTELAPELPPLLGHGLELAGASVQARSWATGIRTGCGIDAILAGDLERTQQEQGGAQWER